MKNLIKNVALAAVAGFAVGSLLSLVCIPLIAGALGLTLESMGGMANPMFMGLFAGSWGAIGALITPVCSYVFNGFKKEPAKETVVEKQQVLIVNAPSQEVGKQFAAAIEEQRVRQAQQVPTRH